MKSLERENLDHSPQHKENNFQNREKVPLRGEIEDHKP